MSSLKNAFDNGRRLAFDLLALPIVLACCAGVAFAAEKAGQEILLEKEPAGAVDVLALKKDAKDQDNVVVVGRIGGRKDPWIKGMAAFPIVDRSLTPCNEIEGDMCKYPWDYCCESNLPQATVLIKFVDEKGKVIKQDPRTFFDVKELQTVVVAGKAQRDKSGNITVLASKLHVRPDKQVAE
jgi:hypothetical protein